MDTILKIIVTTFIPLVVIFYTILLSITLIRPKKMRDLAKEFGFKYIKFGENKIDDLMTYNKKEKNILTGNYNGKEFFIKDVNTVTVHGGGVGKGGRTGVRITSINGKNYSNYFLPYLSISKLRSFIKGETDLQKYSLDRRTFNEGIMILFFVLGIALSFIAYNYFIETINSINLKFLILILNIIFISFGLYLGKLMAYKKSNYIE